MRLAIVVWLALAACATRPPTPVSRAALETHAERSGYVTTGRYAEVEQLCRAFARSYVDVACEAIGETGEGRPIWSLRVARSSGPYIYVQGGIHAGEIEGKDAGFAFVRDLLDGTVAPGALDHVNLVFVPVINPDGHERFGPNNRPNQRGPAEMGFRSNGARLNLNRDWVKLDSPEIRAVLGVFKKYDPFIAFDLHTADGAKFQHDIAVMMGPIAPRADGLDRVAERISTYVMDRLTALGHKPLDFYPAFIDDERPHSGFVRGEAPPRFSTSYPATRGRIGVLVETHSWRTYKERIESTYHVLQSMFELAPAHAASWQQTMVQVDVQATTHGGTEVTLRWDVPEQNGREIEFAGYSYERRMSDATGGTWLVYDESSPETWRVPLYDQFVPEITVRAPYGGYLVDGGFARAVAEVLDAHGIRYVPAGAEQRTVEAFRGDAKFLPPYEGRTRAQITGAWKRETRTLDQGAIFVPIDQPLALLVMQLFEPAMPDSLATWGVFNTCFSQVEWIEPYVAEDALREMLKDSALAGEWAEYVAQSPSPADRIEWIHRHHPSWDERVGLLPVYRVLSRASAIR
jgi:hypothetical protein